MKNLFFFITLGVILISCDDGTKVTQIHSYPEWNQEQFSLKENEKAAFIFHYGEVTKNLLEKRELKAAKLPKSMPHEIKVGGVAILSSYLKTIQKRFQKDALFLSGGRLNFHQGDKIKKKIIKSAYKQLPLDALLLSKDDINTPKNEESSFLSDLPWFNSNILSIKTGEPTDIFNRDALRVIKSNKLSVGLIGTTSYSMLDPVERNEISGFYFQDPVTTILRSKNQLSKKGVDIIALYFDGPLTCEQALKNQPIALKDLPSLESVCQKDSELQETLKRLPPHSVDVVFTNSPKFAGALYKKTPILSLHSPSSFIHALKLAMRNGKLDLENSYLLEAVKLCHEIFVGTQDCVFELKDQGNNEERFNLMEKTSFATIPSRFLGHEIFPDSEISITFNGK